MKLKEKTAIITGSTSGIGKATVELFLEQGANVMMTDISEKGETQSEEYQQQGFSCSFSYADVTKKADVQKVFRMTEELFGSIDIVFANAGIGESAVIEEVEMEDWEKVIQTNLTSVYLTNKIAIEHMLSSGGGTIINNGSVLGEVGQPDVTANAAAKGGVVNLTRTLGVNYATKGIRINAVSPGYVKTPVIMRKTESFIEKLIERHPIGRLAEPEEIANVVSFLASDESSFMTGSNVMVDGGYTAQ
ncbi:SDR family NAD(P)-dependent oxidoreductase [Salibacterium aidingense]|uniref:SDR family NAD(P)-dependent oxidoreductase n=1 Tax=Salibacterium aidingense TaxID=384933 RepID=UPI003BBF109D